MEATGGHGADVALDMVGGSGTEAVWTCMACEGRYVAVGFNDDPDSGLTGRPLRKVSTGNFSVLGLMMSYHDVPLVVRRLGLNPFPPSVGAEVHAALLGLAAGGRLHPAVERRITMDEVAAALAAHEQRRTFGRTVVMIGAS
jgi:NADPH2:quinone reductase